MECVLHREAQGTLRRLVDTLTEASSVALLRFTQDPRHPLVLQALDATWTCGLMLGVKREAWTQWTLPREVMVRVDLRLLTVYLRKGRGRQTLQWCVPEVAAGSGVYWPSPTAPEQQQVHLQWSATKALVLHDVADRSPYLDALPTQQWLRHSVSLAEFSNIILEMAVGGTQCWVRGSAQGGPWLVWTEFDTGYMEFELPGRGGGDGGDVTTLCGPFVVKWLKLLCGLTTLTDQAEVCVEPRDRETLAVHTGDAYVDLTLWVRRYLGPHGFVVPEGFQRYACRTQV